ncbi:GntR family transcriptional regulator [Neobacillus mesonae]|nr:GntR family transcriptional regulator [Neobacillus mesonae]
MSQPLYQQIITSLLQEIDTGRLLPGDQVPSEKELTDKYQVSRITAKKALDLLADEGVIVRIRGKGSYVNSPETLADETENDEGSKRGSCDTLLIGAIFPSYTDGYGLELQYAVEKRIAEMGGTLIIKRSNHSIHEEEEAIDSLLELGVNGIIVFPVDSKEYNQRLLKMILEGFPVVVVDRNLKGIQACTVHTDNKTAAFKLAAFLLERGHQHIAFISPDPNRTSTLEDRLAGFQQAFLASGTRLCSEYLITDIPNGYSVKSNDSHTEERELIRRLLREHPQITAFVCAEYEIAIILYKMLESMNLRVPEDCSIVCFDCPDDPFDRPRFTHIRQYESKMGQVAVDMLYSQIKHEEVPKLTLLGFEFKEGRST